MYLKIFTFPSNTRNWNRDQAILPEVSFNIKNREVYIQNIRNFSYASTTSYTEDYYNKTFKLDNLHKVYYIVEPFSDFAGSARTFISFEFKNQNTNELDFVSISVEIRKEKGEKFSALNGIFNQYEIMYVIADEKDVIKLRSNYRKDLVYVYPINSTKEKNIALFTSMLEKAESLRNNPEFYNTLFNNRTTNIAKHVNKVSPKRLTWNLSYIIPASSDKYIYSIGLIDTDLSFENMRKKFLINEKAIKYTDDPLFSQKIRE